MGGRSATAAAGGVLQPALEECLPRGIDVPPICCVPVVSRGELQPLTDAEKIVNFLCPIKVRPALQVIGVSSGLRLASTYQEKWPRRSHGQQFVMVALETRTIRIRIQQALHGPAELGNRVVIRVDIFEPPPPAQEIWP